MKKVTIKSALLAAAALLTVSQGVFAQDYEDDLYYSPSKAAKQRKAREEALAKARAAELAAREYKAADTYTTQADKPLAVDVDTYNRRTASDASATASAKTEESSDFNYTRRIERYHNPEIVSSSKDEDLKEYYYSTPSESDVNIYVINTLDPDWYAWNSFWPTYSWNNPYYWNAWYNPYRWPTFSFGFGYDPWFNISWGSPWFGPSWGWSWGWNWGWTSPWHPGWHPGWGPGWGHNPPPPPGHRPGYRPGYGGGWAVNSPGASRPRRPNAYQGADNRHNSFDQNRPGAMGTSNRRPSGNSQSGYRPAAGSNGNHSSGYTPSNNSRRGNSSRYGSSNTTPRNNNNNSYDSSPRRSSSNDSYNRSNNYNSNRSSGSSYGTGRGSFGGGNSSGGSYGGGASRGRRR